MSFPWKKVKNNRISKLVNDHLQNSQKRRDGSSLVVETGFPTSLVDLFIKNREKLKKPSKKKRQSLPIITPVGYGGDQVISAKITSSPSPLEPPSPPTNTPLSCPSPPQSPVILPSPSKDVGEILVLGNKNVDEDVSEGCAERAGVVNGFFLLVLKMFLVVVLALGTKRLALGVTIAACFLFFLEYARKRVLRPSSVKAETLPRFCGLLRSEEIVDKNKNGILAMEIEKDEPLRPCSSSLMSSESRCDRIQEIQVVEARYSSVARVDEIQCENEITSGCRFSDGLQNDVEPVSEVLEVKKKKKSRRAALKSKMKKFIAIKLKFPRKVHEVEKIDAAPKDEGVSIRAARESYQQGDSEESASSSRFSNCSTSTQNDDTNRVSEAKEKTATTVKEGSSSCKTDHGSSLRYLVVLCLIILMGLIQSRVIALGLTLSCCFLLKLCESRCNYLS